MRMTTGPPLHTPNGGPAKMAESDLPTSRSLGQSVAVFVRLIAEPGRWRRCNAASLLLEYGFGFDTARSRFCTG